MDITNARRNRSLMACTSKCELSLAYQIKRSVRPRLVAVVGCPWWGRGFVNFLLRGGVGNALNGPL